MALALVASDVVFLLLCVALYGGAAWVSAWVTAPLSSPWLVWPVAALVFPTVLTFGVALLHLPLPRLRPGRYDLMKGPMFWSWMIRALLRRALLPAPLKPLFFSFATFRFLTLRALGAKVAFGANMSTDVDLLDPALLVVETGATLGARSLVSGHFVDGGKLVLGEVRIEQGALLAVDVLVGPDSVIGAKARLLGGVKLGPCCQIGAKAVLEPGVRGEGWCHVDPGARVPAFRDLARHERFTAEGESLDARA
ncbi:MAG: hypothetical protein H6721_02550 [Sandaracinus sp.]|nr:hypothetical protein [Sandaracinus sp.]MCB9631013.1 hypothetical protein [Sandaracinus sp.]